MIFQIGAENQSRAWHSKAQEAETLIACNILNGMMNGMTALGRPASYAIGA